MDFVWLALQVLVKIPALEKNLRSKFLLALLKRRIYMSLKFLP